MRQACEGVVVVCVLWCGQQPQQRQGVVCCLARCIRIRSKTQGIALSLGDKITLKQKG